MDDLCGLAVGRKICEFLSCRPLLKARGSLCCAACRWRHRWRHSDDVIDARQTTQWTNGFFLTLSRVLTPIGVIVFNPSAVVIGASGAQINYIVMKSNQYLLIQAKLHHSRPKESRTASYCATVTSLKTERDVRRVGTGARTVVKGSLVVMYFIHCFALLNCIVGLFYFIVAYFLIFL